MLKLFSNWKYTAFLTGAPNDDNASSIASIKYSSNLHCVAIFSVFWGSKLPISIKSGLLIESEVAVNELLMFFWPEKVYSPFYFPFHSFRDG
jgi:hypothetical protein